MSSTAVQQQQEQITYPDLPLAIYREIAAHLEQVNGVQTSLIPQDSQTFHYTQSQIVALAIEYSSEFKTQGRSQVEAILNYYADRYGMYRRQFDGTSQSC